MSEITLWEGDCLELMQDIPSGSVDMILCDLPYNTTACHWDQLLPFQPLWSAYDRVLKDNGAIVLTANQPFTTALIASNMRIFKYCLVWDKKNTGCPVVAKKRPLPTHEDIVVFGKGKITYNPIKTDLNKHRKWKQYKNSKSIPIANPGEGEVSGLYPKSILCFSNANRKDSIHPTQKPVALFEYLIKTYTNEGETVLDNTAGSMTTAIAALNTNRNAICIEKDPHYFKVGSERVEQHKMKLQTRQLQLL